MVGVWGEKLLFEDLERLLVLETLLDWQALLEDLEEKRLL
jgi:hypothetical protein